MAAASPTPFASSTSFGNPRPRHAASRTFPRAYAPRPILKRNSPFEDFQGQGFSADAPMLQSISYGDSSDDEVPPPMAFSALTRAILEDNGSKRGSSPPPKERERERDPRYSHSQSTHSRQDSLRSGTERDIASRAGTPPSRGQLRISRRSPPPDAERVSPRIVHLSGSRPSSGLRRPASSAEVRRPRLEEGSGDEKPAVREYITPAPAPRTRSAFRSRANSSSTSAGPGSSQAHSFGSQSRGGGSSQEDGVQASSYENSGNNLEGQTEDASRGQAKTGEAVPGSMRHKRLNIGSGTFLRGAPVRRPLRRRQSEEDQSPRYDDHENASQMGEEQLGVHNASSTHSRSNSLRPSQQHVEVQDFASSRDTGFHQHRGQDDHQSHPGTKEKQPPSRSRPETKPLSSDYPARLQVRERPPAEAKQVQPAFRIPAPPSLPSYNDQENEPPPTFKRNKPGVLTSRDKIHVMDDQKESKMLAETPAMKSPQRQALAPRNVNTPQRAAPPPPPKMSVLETATATAGASTVKSKRKRSHITINGKMLSLKGRLGKGGSSDVYRVMAENDKMFALKKVNLENCNEDTIRGYKGEIDLLTKLENVERVVRLFDWEMNESKQSLSVLMEMGESDLNRLLARKIHPDDAELDLTFTRHYWREMLTCVAAVHAHDIVHSDLKPANFLLVQGRLKLIDFGIANAIETDHTVNVHRETNVGTPNYMSPESLQDTNASTSKAAGAASGGGAGVTKLMKLGKPSDVWSLGCILYQMTYGKPPFAYIQNQWNRVMAIINPSVVIEYPPTGIGGITVPGSLRRLLKSCLNRDASERPTLAQLLDHKEPFLNPDRALDEMEREGAVPVGEMVLEQILNRVVERCRDPARGCPSKEENKVYASAFLERVRELRGLPPVEKEGKGS